MMRVIGRDRLAFALGAFVLGLALVVPWLAPAAWLGIAGFAYGISVSGSRRRALVGLFCASVLTRALWLCWAHAMAQAMNSGGSSAQAWLVAAGFVLSATLPTFAVLAVGVLVFQTRWIRFWLPVGWAVGERLQCVWTSMSNDWLVSQVDCAPVMRALALIGMVPTTILCLFLAASAGEALAQRRAKVFLPALVIPVGLLLLPALPPPDLALLEGVGAVHMRSPEETPAIDDGEREPELVVWPEAALHLQPQVGEGTPRDDDERAALRAPLGLVATTIVGAVTHTRFVTQNSALLIGPDGRVLEARAKSGLLPVFERKFLGYGSAPFTPGVSAPIFSVTGPRPRKVIPLVCGELLDRSLVRAGQSSGGELLAVLASDRYQAASATSSRQVLSELRLRAIEYHLPAVYSSMYGSAAIVASDGTVLARSEQGSASGVLTWSAKEGARDRAPKARPSIKVLYSAATPRLRPDCLPGRCSYEPLETFHCTGETFETVIVAGHASPPTYVGRSAAEIARAVACFRPELVVIDTCFGASPPLLKELAVQTHALVVGSSRLLGSNGFHYGRAFFEDLSVRERAAAVSLVPSLPLFRAYPDAQKLAAIEAAVAIEDPAVLRGRLRQWSPTLVSAETEPGQEIVVAADWQRLGSPTTR